MSDRSVLEKCGPCRLLREPICNPSGPENDPAAAAGSAKNCTALPLFGSLWIPARMAWVSPLKIPGLTVAKPMGKALAPVRKANPVCQLSIPEIDQPPMIWLSTPEAVPPKVFPRPNGNSYKPIMLTACLRSKSESPLQTLRLVMSQTKSEKNEFADTE